MDKETIKQRRQCATHFQKLDDLCASLKEKVGSIESQVSNHLPTQIKDLDTKNDQGIEKLKIGIQDVKDTINKRPTWLMTFVFLILSFLLGLLATHFK
jgi:demethoxyubiquinone hydroxylase (CLK1/Coq7/Cat5 family)